MAFRKEFRHLSGRRLLRHCESAPTGGPRSRSAVAGRAPTKGARRLRCRPSHLAMTSWLRRLHSQIEHERRRRGSPSKPARVDGVPQRQARRPGGLDRAVFLDCFKKPFPGQRYYEWLRTKYERLQNPEKDRERHRVLPEGRPGGSAQTLSGRNLNDHDGSEPPRYGPICPAAWKDRRRPGVCPLRLAP
jgi:hypothetical protein